MFGLYDFFGFLDGDETHTFALKRRGSEGAMWARRCVAQFQVPITFEKPDEFTSLSRPLAQKVLNARHTAWVMRFCGVAPAPTPSAWRPKALTRGSITMT